MSSAPSPADEVELRAELEFGTLSDLIRCHAARRPGHAALVQDGRKVTYAELDALMDQVAATLQRD